MAEVKSPDVQAQFKCGDKVFILDENKKIKESRINAKTIHERLFEGQVQTKTEWKVDGIERFVEPGVDFFKNKDDLVKSLEG